jgi:hypothetical protein
MHGLRKEGSYGGEDGCDYKWGFDH